MAHTIGWKERVDFPEWRLRRIRAKVDTGARSSALGVARYVLADSPDGPKAWFGKIVDWEGVGT